MERLKFVQFDVLTNTSQNIWGSACKAIHNGTQGLASALKRSTSAHTYRLPEEIPRRKCPSTNTISEKHESEVLTIESVSSNEIHCTVAEDYNWGLSDATVRKAIEELQEDSTNQKMSVEAVRKLIPSRPDIDFVRTDNSFILRFLRSRKFDIHATFYLYCRYYEYRKTNASLFKDFSATEPGIKQALLDGFPGVLTSADQHGHRVLIFFTANWDHGRYGLVAIFRALLLTLENLVEDDDAQVHGFVLIVDWSGFTFRQSSFLQPKLLKLIIEGLQDCFPGRFAGIHFVNQPWYIEAALTLIKSFLKEKTKDKIYLHGNNLTTLHHHIAKDILPAELGGSGPPYNTEIWANQLIFCEENLFSQHQKDISSISEMNRMSERLAVHSETFPSDLCKSLHNGRPSVTELDEEFFLNE